MSQIIYSVGMPLNRGGLGTIGWHAAMGLHRGNRLKGIITTEGGSAGELSAYVREFPLLFQKANSVLNRLQWHHWKDSFFDRWAASWLEKGVDYYGWMNLSLACIRKCHRLGGRTWIDRGSVEPRLQERWLSEAYHQHGLSVDPIAKHTIRRMIKESEETDYIVCASSLIAESYFEAGFKPCKLLVNSLGVDGTQFTPRGPREGGCPIRFVFVGQLSIQKGVPSLLKAWKKLKGSAVKDRKMALILAGVIPPQEKSVIEPLLKEVPDVIWNGHCAEVPKLLSECDILVLPSVQDGFGLVVLEAFATGLPVIISDRVGAKDCVDDGRNGWIFPSGKDDALADQMRWFIQDPSRIEPMKTAALKSAQHFTWEGYGSRLLALTNR
jgi:glycosyltransferase involved in cell wall biosynthesis